MPRRKRASGDEAPPLDPAEEDRLLEQLSNHGRRGAGRPSAPAREARDRALARDHVVVDDAGAIIGEAPAVAAQDEAGVQDELDALDDFAAGIGASPALRRPRDDPGLRADQGKSMAQGRKDAKHQREMEQAQRKADLTGQAWDAFAAERQDQQAPGWRKEKYVDSRTQVGGVR